MSGAGAVAVARVFIAFALSYRGAGRPVRWLVTIAGEVFSSVASAKNSNATSTEPTTEKKARIGIGAFLASERNAVQDQQAHKNCRQRQTEHLCSPIVTRTEYLCSCALICICHEVDPRISLFVVSRGKLERAQAVAPAHVGRLQLSKGRANLYLGAIRRCENGAWRAGSGSASRALLIPLLRLSGHHSDFGCE